MRNLYLRIRYFFMHWRDEFDGRRIDAAFAWELAGAKARFHDELSRWVPVEIGGDDD